MSPLGNEEKSALLKIARAAIHAAVLSGPNPLLDEPLLPARLREKRGVFVTLFSGGELRGCVGLPLPLKPLAVAAGEMAVEAALRDPRFAPVEAGELDSLRIEISVLTPPVAVAPEQVETGRHGLIVSHRGMRGLLLPQVATEYGWSREQFLSETCRKAGLPADAWRHGASIEAFEAEVFSE